MTGRLAGPRDYEAPVSMPQSPFGNSLAVLSCSYEDSFQSQAAFYYPINESVNASQIYLSKNNWLIL